MKYQGTMLVVNDMQKSVDFYKEVLNCHVILDFGANKTLTGGFSLQEFTYWQTLCLKQEEDITFGGNNFELYFEEKQFDLFLKKMKEIPTIQYVHPLMETPWGQRTIKFYDPDHHMIEVSETLEAVCKRFFDTGMTAVQIAERMDVPIAFVEKCLSD